MKRALSFAIACLSLVYVSAQPGGEKPRLGLVLSGGGAKGIAHTRVLQALDSLGIVPDFVFGTSMGAVVGGLYAAGYSGNEIDSIIQVVDWKNIFSNQLTFDQINIEEKDEFGRYIYELSLEGLKPDFGLAVIQGQRIDELLNDLLFHVKEISDFDRLPIPYRCMAADIVKGEPVIMDHGNLATAVRASMSIPTVFPPVRFEGKLLVDGGVFVNLPVEECRKLGADIIIAVDVGGGLMREEELTSAISMLLQTTYLAGDLSYREERNKSDIFIDIVKHLRYSTMDFEQVTAMLEDGQKALLESMPELEALASRMKDYPASKKTIVSRSTSDFKIDRIETINISDDNKRLVLSRFNWDQSSKLSRADATEKVRLLLGTRLFNRISYSIEKDGEDAVLVLQGDEKPNNSAKFALHYDTESGAGVILNFTKRNLMLPASRLVGTVDLAENPRARLNYYYFFGEKMKWWHFTEAYMEHQIVNSFIDGTPLPDLTDRHYALRTALNNTINNRSFWGFGPAYGYTRLRPRIDPRNETDPGLLELIEYQMSTFGVLFQYQYNSLNHVFFPTDGQWFRVDLHTNFANNVEANLFLADSFRVELPIDSRLQNYVRIQARALHIIPLGTTNSLHLFGQAGFTNETTSHSDRLSAYSFGVGDFFRVGGIVQRPRDITVMFTGLREAEVAVPQIITLGVNWQWQLSKNFFVTPSANLLAGGYDPAAFWRTLTDLNFNEGYTDGAFYQFGYGVVLGFRSLIGPVQLSLTDVLPGNNVRLFFRLGFLM